MPQVTGHGFRPVRLQELINVIAINSQQDQALIERQGCAHGFQNGTVQTYEGESVEPVATERLEGQRWVKIKCAQGTTEV